MDTAHRPAAAQPRGCVQQGGLMPYPPQGTPTDAPRRRPPVAPTRPVARARALLRGCRPRHSVKNLLVLTAPALGGHMLADVEVLPGTLIALLTFSCVSAAVYLANDVHDVEEDRGHPVKRARPVASGELPVPIAIASALVLAAGSLGLAFWWAPPLAAVLAGYLGLQAAYTFYVKHVPGADLLIVASGFVLRVVAGGVAAPVALSTPFLVVVAFAALFMVAGKRYSELSALGAAAGTRRSLLGYSQRWLRRTWIGSAVIAGIGYVVAAADLAPLGTAAETWSLVAVLPFCAGLMRYAVHVRRGKAEHPEHLVLRDRVLVTLGATWLAPLAVSVMLTA